MIPDLTFEANKNILSQPTKNEIISSKDDKTYSHGQTRECTSIFKDVTRVMETKISEKTNN